ncbi:hypothetical protein NW762_010692 [Fusarium torreyae]|uniref:Allantoin permease n=1 Tax=Fusarium torreyae TaxID=1237075 RepID=A0A9W8VAD5_9HYPO|nr:hypothetical protein NW762_010692 [Fusarium torreyae]
MTVGNLGGAIGSNIFLAKQAPHYWLGYGFSLGILVCGVISTLVLRSVFMRINRSRDQVPAEEVLSKYSEEQLVDMGDKSPLYRYVW